ncbi:MAG: hypothetical protein NVSMB25_20660 [Thermoleophilaceae bacterium]
MARKLTSRLLAVGATAAILLAVAATAAAATPLLGFNDGWAAPDTARDVTLTRQMGATSDRLQVFWSDTEQRPGVYDWYGADNAYNAMLARGIRPLIDVVTAPAWTKDAACSDVLLCQQTPAHDGDYARYVTTLVRRYPAALAIELGNEPNLHNWWLHSDPARYAQILKVGYFAAKQANPRIRVILAGTCCTTLSRNGNIGAATFLARLYRFGVQGHYDAIGFHVYPGGALGRVAPDVKSELAAMRAVRDAHHDRSKFWITETGFPSSGRSPYSGVVFDEPGQAERIAIDYRVLRAMPDVEAVYFYRLTDYLGRAGDPGSGLEPSEGFYRIGFFPKPAVAALRQALGAPPWPAFRVRAGAPRRVRAGRRFRVSARGFGGRGARYAWVIWRRGHWSTPLASARRPFGRVRISHPGTYRLAVRVVTRRDEFLSPSLRVRVLGGRAHR